MPASKARKKTAFVPRIIFRAAIVGAGVVPMCVVACGGETTGQGGDSGGIGVAATFADGGRHDVAAIGFEAGDEGGNGLGAFDGSVAEIGFDVAAMAFDGFPSVAAIGFDGGSVAEAGFRGDARPDGVAGDAFANESGVADSSGRFDSVAARAFEGGNSD
jgi:hypothetical protein